MHKQKILAILTMMVISTSTYAFKQDAQLCLEVIGNTQDKDFTATLRSTDSFERQRKTNPVSNGVDCVSRTFNHGPKNLKFTLKASNFSTIQIDSSCPTFHDLGGGDIVGGPISTSHANDWWRLTLRQGISGNDSGYKLTCNRSEF